MRSGLAPCRHYLGNVQLSSRGRFCSRACRVPWRWRLVRAPPPSHLAPHWEADPACEAAHTRSVLHRVAGRQDQVAVRAQRSTSRSWPGLRRRKLPREHRNETRPSRFGSNALGRTGSLRTPILCPHLAVDMSVSGSAVCRICLFGSILPEYCLGECLERLRWTTGRPTDASATVNV